MLLSWAHLAVLFCRAHLSVRHQKCLDPVVVTFLAYPIRDGYGCVGHLEPLAEGPGEAFQQGPRKSPEGVVKLLDRLGIKRHLTWVGCGRSGLSGGRVSRVKPLGRLASIKLAGEGN